MTQQQTPGSARRAGFLCRIVLTLLFVIALLPATMAGAEVVLGPTAPPPMAGSLNLSPKPALRALLIGSALTAISFRYDRTMHTTMLNRKWLEFGRIDIGDFYGGGYFLGSLSVAAWGIGAVTHSPDIRETGTVMMKGLVLDFVLTEGLKYAVGRQRPDLGDHHSFPSGHTSFAFAGSTVLALRYGWLVAIPAYALAATTAVARMEDDQHYFSDVVAGAALGTAVGFLVTPRAHRSNHEISVLATPSRVGLAMSF